MRTTYLTKVWSEMSFSNSVEVVGEGGVDEMLLETMGPKYFSGRAEKKAAVEPEKIEEPKKEEVKEEEKEKEEPPKEEEGEKKETDDAADGEKVRVSAQSHEINTAYT